MPHINRIRVNNVKYNFGTQFYDDFIMRFSGKNSIYDLANGGGKSVLMLLLMQNLIPNCTLDEKQPVEKLFRGNGSTVIHSLIEWKLNQNDIQDGYQYMTTGFCARKGKEQPQEEGERENAVIEYFNYCIFYREFNDNDMRNLPLSNGKERITYQGLKNYLRDLEKHDFSLIVKIFDRKGDYQRFISRYGLYESEWELIRGINKTEGHVRTYFENRYKTTRKVVEDLLIEEIIEKSFQNKAGGSQDTQEIAQTLLDIKDKLMELSRKKGEIVHYDQQIEALSSFIQRMHNLKSVYQEKTGLEEELVRTYHTALYRENFKQEQLAKGKEQEAQTEEEVKQLEKQIACGQIQLEEAELSLLEAEAKETGQQLTESRQEVQKLEAWLKQAESANDYLDYLEDKKQAGLQEAAMEGLLAEKEGLLEELYDLVSEIKEKSEEERQRLEAEFIRSQTEYEEAKRSGKEADEALRDWEKKEAVLKSRIAETLAEREALSEEMAKKQQAAGLLVIQQVQEAIREKREEKEARLQEMKELEDKKEQYIQELAQLQQAVAETRQTAVRAEAGMEKAAKQLELFGKWKEKAEHLREIYKERDCRKILEQIVRQRRETLYRLEEQKALLEEKEGLLAQLERGVPLVVSEKTQKLAEYIGRHHGAQVQLGAEYLAGIEGYEREVLLSNLPMLPYSILVEGDFKQITEDRHITGGDYGNCLIPVLSVEALSVEGGLAQEEWLFFAGKERELFLDEGRQTALKETLQKETEELLKEQERWTEYEKVLEEDGLFLTRYLEEYGKEWQREQQSFEDCKAVFEESERRLESLEESQGEKENALKAAKDRLETLKSRQKEEEETFRLLEELEVMQARMLAIQKKSEGLEASNQEAEAKVEENRRKYEELSENRRKIREKTENIKNKRDEIDRDWERVYGAYDKPGRKAVSGLSLPELEVRFLGRKEAFEKEHGDIEDKKRLVENLKSAMERSKSAIEYRGHTLEALAAAYAANELKRTPRQELLGEREKLKERQKALETAAKRLQAQTDNMNRKFGSIGHAKTMVEKQFGAYEPLSPGGDVEAMLQGNEALLLQKKMRLQEIHKEEKELERQCMALESMCQDMERMMKLAGITSEENSKLLEEGVSLKEKYEKLREQYDSLIHEEQRRRNVFESDKDKMLDTLQKLQAHAFAEEMQRSVVYPVSFREVEALISNLTEALSYMELEKERVGKGIEDMEIIKDNFENQCLQTCVTIQRELMRLPEMSKIQLDGQMSPMIQLQIPYIGKERYKAAMSDYIEEIVKNADGFEKPEERLRYIRNQLSFKHLFSVIVKDMNGIRLNLYKRERIREQSRYLRYEEAVGSTGQSQGIYIQFLIAIIHYITSINSGNADAVGLKNVIFLDNPFGAAKDVYIWEPIFQMLKSNHVQLIVPARGTTPVITGRFEVNYILGQKLIDGRQQTVVVDYRSQVEEEEMEYAPLSFEQATLF